MSDYTNIQHGDLDDAAAVNTLLGHDNLADYVGFGLQVQGPDYTTSPATFGLTSGKIFVMLDSQEAPGAGHVKYDCLVSSHLDSRSGIDLPNAGLNYIWVVLNINTRDSPYVQVTSTDSPPVPGESLKIAEIDTDAEQVEAFNRYPNGEFDLLTANHLFVNEAITWPDGETTHEHPITYGEEINNYNSYYDIEEGDPPGVVAEAGYAEEAGHAETATNADYADQAGNADLLQGYTPEELMDEAAGVAGGEWTKILDEPYVKDWLNKGPDVRFDLEPYDFDRYRVRIVMENHSNIRTGISCTLNDIDQRCYSHINLLPAEEYGERVVWRTNTDVWTVADCMGNAMSVADFYVALPHAIVGDGCRNRYPVMQAGETLTGTVRSYHLTGILHQSLDEIDEIRLSTGEDELAIKVQLYGQRLFPES